MKTSKKRGFFDSDQKSLISDRKVIFILILLFSINLVFAQELLSPGSDVKITVVPDTCGNDICGSNESCSSCQADCGSCPSSGGGGGEEKQVIEKEICQPVWKCEDWRQCLSFVQIRECIDKASCIQPPIKEETKFCIPQKTKEILEQRTLFNWPYYAWIIIAIIWLILFIPVILFKIRSKKKVKSKKPYQAVSQSK